MIAAAVITPGDDERAVAEIGHRRLVLRVAVCIGIDQEVVADLLTRRIKALAKDINPVAAIMTAAIVITPGDDKAAVRQRGNLRIILAARRISVHQNLVAGHNRRIDRITVRIRHADDLGEDVVAGAAT